MRRTLNNGHSQGPRQQSNYMTQKPSMSNFNGHATQTGGDNDIDPGLELLNRVQMFQIAVNKINHNLEIRKKEPIFKLASNAGNSHTINGNGSNNNNNHNPNSSIATNNNYTKKL